MKNKVALIIFLFFLICNKNYSQITMDLNQLTGINNNNLVGDTIKLETQTYRAFKKMESAAKNDGINLKIVSAYRGYDRQKIIWNKKYERFTNEFSFEPKNWRSNGAKNLTTIFLSNKIFNIKRYIYTQIDYI